MVAFFYCTKLQGPNGDFVYSNGITTMERADLDELRRRVVEGLRQDGVEAQTSQICVLAFNKVD